MARIDCEWMHLASSGGTSAAAFNSKDLVKFLQFERGRDAQKAFSKETIGSVKLWPVQQSAGAGD